LPARAQARATLPLRRGVLRQGHSCGHDTDARQGHRRRFQRGAVLQRIALKQGTELVALQRDNLELGNIAPQNISKQIPAWSILTSAYLFRDANHLSSFWSSDLGVQYKKQAEEQMKIKILGPTFFGTRQVGLR